MQTILSVTDFNESGNAAVHYAAALALQTGSSLHILHTYIVPIAIGDQAQSMPLMSLNEMEDISREGMSRLLAGVQSAFPKVTITQEISYGDWRDAASKEDMAACLLVILGGDAEDGFWLGSDARDAALHYGKPVLIVPPGAGFRPLANICLACDAAAMQHPETLQSLLPVMMSCNAALHLLHVHTSKNEEIVWDDAALKKALPGIKYACHELTAPAAEVDKAIHDFAVNIGADWLVLIPHHYSFIAGLFHNSHTRAAFRFADLPVLSLH